MSNFKKAFSVAVTALTAIGTMGGAALLASPVSAAASAGSLIKMTGNPAVYYFDGSKRFVFPNQNTYMSWYPDFSGVTTISSTELSSYPIGGNVTVRPGTWLVKITTDPKVYAIEPGGKLRAIDSEARALKLYGSLWNKHIIDVPDAFFVNYTTGTPITSDMHPTGSVVKYASSSTWYYIDNGTKRAFASDMAATANWIRASHGVTTDISYPDGSSITGVESALTNVSGGASVVAPGSGTGLAAALASDTSAAATHASGTAYNNALKFNVTAGSDGPVTINSVTVTRAGISIDSNISGVAIFDAAGKRHGNFVTFADTKATASFSSNPIVVPAGTTQAIWVKTNISGTSGTYMVSIAKATDIGTTATVSGSFPINGSTFSLASGASIVGAVTVDAVLVHNNGTNDATAVNVNLGVTNQEIARFRLVANANEDVKISKITMYNNGNTNDADVKNIKLVAPDGSTLATVAQASSRDVVFDLSASPYVIVKGNTKDLSVRIDVVGGSTRNVRYVIQNDYDLEVYGKDTGSGILATAAATVDGAFPVGDSSGAGTNCAATVNCINKLTVAAGTALFNKASDSPTGNIAVGTSGLVLGKWEFTPQGEDMELRQMTYTLTYGTALTGTFRIQVNGSTVYSVAPASMGATTVPTAVTLNSYPTIAAGSKAILTIVGDTSTTVAAGATYLAALDVTQVKRLATNDLVDPGVTSTAASTLTVSTAALTVSKNSSFANTTVVAGLANAKVGSFNLTASSTEDVAVSSLSVLLTNATNISNLMLKVGNTQYGSTTTSPSVTPTANVVSISDLTVTKGTSVALDVYVTTNSSTTGTEVASISAASATGKASGTTVTATGLTATGQTITISTGGTLTLALDTTNTPVAAIAHSGELSRSLLVTRVTSNNAEAVKVQTVQVSARNGTASLRDLMLFVNGVQVGTTTQLNGAVALFTATDQTAGLFTVPQDTTVILTVKGSTTLTSGLNSQAVANIALDYVEAIGVSGGQKIKPGTTLSTTWSATNITAAGVSITVADTTGFHRGDVVFAYDTTNGGTLGIITAEPTSTTAMTVSGLVALTYATGATISKVETGATTAASAGTSGTATAAVSYTVTSTTGFTANDPVIINGATTSQLGIVTSITSSTAMVIQSLSTTATGTAANISKIGTDTLGTTAATVSAAQAPTAMTVGSTTGFNVGDMVLYSDVAGGNAGTYCMVTAVGSSTSMTMGCSAAVTATGTDLIVRVGSTNSSTTLVTTAASAGNRVIAATATTVTDTTGFGAADVTLSIAATGGAILGKAAAITSATALTVASASASGTTTTRLTRLPGAASAGSILTFHDVEPVISSTAGFVGGAATGQSGHVVGSFDIKADGDRNMLITRVNVQANGSNLPWYYVTSYDLYSGSTLLASATPLNAVAVTAGTANVLTGTAIYLCDAASNTTGSVKLTSTAVLQAAANKIFVNDKIVIANGVSHYITATVTAKVVGANAGCETPTANDIQLTVSNSSTTGTAPLGTTATSVQSFNVNFDSNSATPLPTQTVTAGSTLTLKVQADTTSVRTGLSAGTTASYNVKINGTQGASNGGLTWGYTPSGGTAISSLTISDSYPANGPTFTF